MKNFLKQVLAVWVALAVIAGVGVAAVVVLVAMATPGPPVLAKGTMLTLDMSVNITEAAPGLDPEQAIQDAVLGETPAKSAQLHALLKGLEWAAADDRVAGLYLHGSFTPWGYGSGYAALRELRDALERFQKAGKPVHAFLTMPRPRDYYLASVAQRITLHPTGAIELPGLAAEVMFYAAALKKYRNADTNRG